MQKFLSAWPRWLPVLVAALATFGVTLAVTDNNGDGIPERIVIEKKVTVTPPATAIDGPDADIKRDDALPLNQAARNVIDDVAGEGEISDPLRETDDGPVVLNEGPLAAQEFPGCRTAFVRNSSSRSGATPRVIVWHQTVSRERGQASQDALTAMANSLSSGVSWHFLIGRSNGLCTFSVPLNLKAWTQANANPFAIGIEVEAFGDEGTYVTGAGRAKLLAVTRELGRRYGIPMRRGRVVNCQPVVSGIVEHEDLGPCGGGHVDVTLGGVDELIAEAAKRPITARDRRQCANVHAYRERRRGGRPATAAGRGNQDRRLSQLRSRGVQCVKGKPVRKEA